jgi:general secretion pathway protein D
LHNFSLFFLVSCAAERAQREGRALVSEGKIDAGLKKLEEAALLEPTSANFRASYLHTKEFIISNYLLQAEFLLKQKKIVEAEHLYQEILKLEPNNNRALNALKTISINERHEKLLAEVNLEPQNKDAESVKNILRLILSENPKTFKLQICYGHWRKIIARLLCNQVLTRSLKKQ